MSKVYSFNQAMEAGFQPRVYQYAPALIPLGEYKATLDFKTWGKTR